MKHNLKNRPKRKRTTTELGGVVAHKLDKFILKDDVLWLYAEEEKKMAKIVSDCQEAVADFRKREEERKQKLQQWLDEFDDFLVQWLQRDVDVWKLKKGVNYYPSQDLDLILSFREKFEQVLKE